MLRCHIISYVDKMLSCNQSQTLHTYTKTNAHYRFACQHTPYHLYMYCTWCLAHFGCKLSCIIHSFGFRQRYLCTRWHLTEFAVKTLQVGSNRYRYYYAFMGAAHANILNHYIYIQWKYLVLQIFARIKLRLNKLVTRNRKKNAKRKQLPLIWYLAWGT